ncbi:hypothetical protein LL912_24040 [Niabella sp. CC-SYL272]|uniref:hypothetical protein n=1 Tax=Niabella agricola TaxID=2891571 RepID=UPI001F176E6E|nr:hypothetical protein [Niabella agricola]MCF3111881.1 hypothetical protein [Niabella agricola]
MFSFIAGCLRPPASPAHRLSSSCADAKTAAEKATLFSKQQPYRNALAAVIRAATDQKEHAVSFGCISTDSILYSAVSNGAVNTAIVPAIINRFADLHNHPENRPPSSGDLYQFIDQAIASNGEYQKFVVLPNGTQYALVLVNIEAAKAFNTRFPRVRGIRDNLAQMQYQPTFPKSLVDEVNQLKGWNGATEEAAMTYLLQKYDAGVALLKKTTDGNFRKVYTVEQQQKDGTPTYTAYTCAR